MSDATIRNFCSYTCVMNFQGQYTKSPITIPTSDAGATDPVPTGIPKRAIAPPPVQLPRPMQPVPTTVATTETHKKQLPVISSVTSLAAIANGQTQGTVQLANNQQTMQPITLQGSHPVCNFLKPTINVVLSLFFILSINK